MRNFKVYKTSAGAGKTYSIVKEFIIQSVLEGSSAQNLLAITFTNKAANEMKDRIIEYLFQIKNQNTYTSKHINELIDSIANETKKNHNDIKNAAEKILQIILHKYHYFSVSTIDSFVHDLLRTFSRDLKLPDNFNVELEEDILIGVIVSELYTQLGKNDKTSNEITKYMIDFSLRELEENDKWDITWSLKNIAKIIFSEEGMQYLDEIRTVELEEYKQSINNIWEKLRGHAKNIREISEKAMNAIHSANLEITDFYYSDKGIAGFFKKNTKYVEGSQIKTNSYITKTIDEGNWSKSNSKTIIPTDLQATLTDLYNKIIFSPLTPHLKLLNEIRKSLTPMALVGTMLKILDEYKESENIIHISEFNKYISDIVRNEPAPFIYERIGQLYKHFFIDEFQDTSIVQWHNILPLIDNALSQQQGNNPSTTFIVGDIKQAIYRFRNSEMQQLMELPNIYAKELSGSHYSNIENNLRNNYFDQTTDENYKNTNYRSDEYIVEFNNKHFEWIHNQFDYPKTNDFISRAYKDASQAIAQGKEGKGLVEVHILNNETYKEASLHRVVEIIKFLAKLENESINYNDIAILVRTKANAKNIAQYLMQLKEPIPVISDESLELSFSPKVNFLISLLKIIENNNSPLAIANAVSYIYQYIKTPNHIVSFGSYIEQIFRSNSNPFGKFDELLNDIGISINWNMMNFTHLNTAITYLIDACSFNKTVDPYILFFQNTVIDYTKQNNGNISDFIEWWELIGSKKSIIVPEGANAVKILTIHKSKGLQFENVIYPFADFSLVHKQKVWMPKKDLPDIVKNLLPNDLEHLLISETALEANNDNDAYDIINAESKKQELDGLNIHYVAMTRAKNKLFVLTKKEDDEKGNLTKISHIINKFINEKKNDKEFHLETDEENDIYKYGINTEINILQQETSLQDQPELHTYHTQTNAVKTLHVKRSKVLKKATKLQIGIQFHLFLSQTNSLNNIQEKFISFCAKNNTDNEKQQIMQLMLNQLIENQEYADLIFSDTYQTANEVNIITKNGLYKPDKLIWKDNEIKVIDFKTGKPNEKHKKQVANYKQLLTEMSYQVNDAYLIYIDEDKIHTIKV